MLSFTCARAVAVRTAAACAVVLAACADGSPTEPRDGRLTLVNATADSVGYAAVSQEVASLTDPFVSEFDAASFGSHVVSPGASVGVPVGEIDGYAARSGVVFFIFRIAGGRARYSTSIAASGAELRASGFRVTVPGATSTR